MGWAALALTGLDNAGFPDGFVSDYDRATLALHAILSFWILLAGIFLFARSIFSQTGRLDILVGFAAVLFLYLPGICIEECPRWPFCADLVTELTGRHLDDGIGG